MNLLAQALLDSLLESVWLVDPRSLRITALNQRAVMLLGMSAEAQIGKPIVDLAASPEDMYFWEDVAAGLAADIQSQTLLRTADGIAIPVERIVRKVAAAGQDPVFVVAACDRRGEVAANDALEHRMAALRATLESSTDGILVTDLEGRIQHFNTRFAELWQLEIDHSGLIEGKTFARSIAGTMADKVLDVAQYQRQLSALQAQPLVQSLDTVHLRDGRTLERNSVPQLSRSRPQGRVYAFRDATQQLAQEAQLRLSAKVFVSSPDAIFITDADLNYVQVNPRFETLTQTSAVSVIGTSAKLLFFDATQPDLQIQIQLALTAQGMWSGEVWRKVGEQSISAEVSWVALRDEAGAICNTVGFFKDLTERIEAQRRIEKLAYRDALTGLPNRLLLGQKVEYALRLAERAGASFAILFIDLDRFKNINDSMGHAFGDRVLIEVANRIQHCLREVDTLSRMGGDEFVAFLQDADAHGAEVAARRILDCVSPAFMVDGMQFSLGCSIGIALYPDDGRCLDDLIKASDTAMYRVKERGRGNFRFYQPQMNVDLLSRMKMEHAMRLALEKGEYRVHYQPQVCLDSGALLGAEALVRWRDPELGNVPPSTFIPLAEETGLIIAIGNWVLSESVRQAAAWQLAGKPVVVSVNVSAMQFQQGGFVERVAQVLQEAGLEPKLLELELTESILVQDANEALARLHALAALGISLAIDDFGTGYSSLAYLKKFPISKLKIDRTFVMGLPGDESDRAIVGATLAMAHALKLHVVAEGVETQAQHDFLRTLQCAAFQGYLFSPAVPANEFLPLVSELPERAAQASLELTPSIP